MSFLCLRATDHECSKYIYIFSLLKFHDLKNIQFKNKVVIRLLPNIVILFLTFDV